MKCTKDIPVVARSGRPHRDGAAVAARLQCAAVFHRGSICLVTIA
eukprot:UN13409